VLEPIAEKERSTLPPSYWQIKAKSETGVFMVISLWSGNCQSFFLRGTEAYLNMQFQRTPPLRESIIVTTIAIT
jgi:hypothetical protein